MGIRSRTMTLYRIGLWLSLGFLTLTIAFIFIVTALPSVFGDTPIFLVSILLILTLFFAFVAVLCGSGIISQKQLLAQLRSENTYVLGEPTEFFNLDAFKLRVNKMRRRGAVKSMSCYITAFTPTAINITTNKNRADILKNLNLKLTRFIEGLFSSNNKSAFDPSRNVYGFSRGFFFICTFTNDVSDVHKIINALSNEMFRMVNEDKVKIWVQPFYGICELKKDVSVVVAFENALVARDISEKNYESFTFFKELYKKEDGSITNEIAKALENNEFIPYYQPKYSLKEKRFISSEALARWNSPEHGILPPSKFIDEAERAGLLNTIDLRIFELAVRDLGENLRRGRTTLPVSVNFSLYEFFSKNFINIITDTLAKYQVPAHFIEIEITETTSQANKFLSLAVIRKIKELGIRVLMDDFGSGYSQINSLRQIPFDAIKIDKSYTDKLIEDEKTRSIFKYLVELGHTNDMEVIVEGVETKEQVEILRKLKADTIQGYFYSRPISFDEFNELVKSQNQGKKGEKA